MLKTRIIAVLIIKNGIVVQSVGFERYLPIGSPSVAIEYLNKWGIDEIVYLDIDATPMGRKPQFQHISEYSKHCQVPLTIGGGIKEVDDIKRALHGGADKIVINSAALRNRRLINEGARLFGTQCIMISIDAKMISENEYETYVNSGSIVTGWTPAEHATMAVENGAGEILLNSIDRNGSKQGYDVGLIKQVENIVNIPIIVCGGAGHPKDFREVLLYNISAVAAGNFFHYSEHSVTTLKSYLKAADENIRLDTYVTYEDFDHDILGRPGKKDDAVLEKLFVGYTPEEII